MYVPKTSGVVGVTSQNFIRQCGPRQAQ